MIDFKELKPGLIKAAPKIMFFAFLFVALLPYALFVLGFIGFDIK